MKVCALAVLCVLTGGLMFAQHPKQEYGFVASAENSLGELKTEIILNAIYDDGASEENTRMVESFLRSQLPYSDETEKALLKKQAQKWGKEMADVYAEWETDVPESRRLELSQKIKEIRAKHAKAIKETKAVKTLELIPVTEEN